MPASKKSYRKSAKKPKSVRTSKKRASSRRVSRRVSRRRSGRGSGRSTRMRASLTKLAKHVKSLEAHVEKAHKKGVSQKTHDRHYARHSKTYHGNVAVGGADAAATTNAEATRVDETRQNMGYYFADLAVYYAKMAKLFSDK
jgi:hypothetical protein